MRYEPQDLIEPRSALTGERPEMRNVANGYLRMEGFRGLLEPWLERLRESGHWRPFAVSSLLEHFAPPTVHVTRDQLGALKEAVSELPTHARGYPGSAAGCAR